VKDWRGAGLFLFLLPIALAKAGALPFWR